MFLENTSAAAVFPASFQTIFLDREATHDLPPFSPCPPSGLSSKPCNWNDYAHLAFTCQMQERLRLFHSPAYCPSSVAVREMLGEIKALSWEAGSYPRFQMCLCMPHLPNSYTIFKTPPWLIVLFATMSLSVYAYIKGCIFTASSDLSMWNALLPRRYVAILTISALPLKSLSETALTPVTVPISLV